VAPQRKPKGATGAEGESSSPTSGSSPAEIQPGAATHGRRSHQARPPRAPPAWSNHRRNRRRRRPRPRKKRPPARRGVRELLRPDPPGSGAQSYDGRHGGGWAESSLLPAQRRERRWFAMGDARSGTSSPRAWSFSYVRTSILGVGQTEEATSTDRIDRFVSLQSCSWHCLFLYGSTCTSLRGSDEWGTVVLW
jgi:hypothetical protein